MIGVILRDIIGSKFGYSKIQNKKLKRLTSDWHLTGNSIMTLAIAKAVYEHKHEGKDLRFAAIQNMREYGKCFPFAGYENSFDSWLNSNMPLPYNGFENDAAMRVSPVAYAASSIEECKDLAYAVTEVTHNHKEGLKGAEAIAVAVYLAKIGSSKEEIRMIIHDNYYPLNFTLDEIRNKNNFSADGSKQHSTSCQKTVPKAIQAFLESKDFLDAIRNAVSIGGETDTIAAMTGSIAEAFYGIPKKLEKKSKRYYKRAFYYIKALKENKKNKKHIKPKKDFFMPTCIILLCLTVLFFVLPFLFDKTSLQENRLAVLALFFSTLLLYFPIVKKNRIITEVVDHEFLHIENHRHIASELNESLKNACNNYYEYETAKLYTKLQKRLKFFDNDLHTTKGINIFMFYITQILFFILYPIIKGVFYFPDVYRLSGLIILITILFVKINIILICAELQNLKRSYFFNNNFNTV